MSDSGIPDIPPGGPAFLDPARAEAVAYPTGDERPVFDDELREEPNPEAPSLGIRERHREIARLHAMGITNNEICKRLGYTPAWVSTMLRDPFVQSEIARWRGLMFSARAGDILKGAAEDAAREIHRIILDPNTKETTRLAAAQFAVEKVTGKAKQEIDVRGGDINYYINIKQEMIRSGEIVDVTPAQPGPEREVVSRVGGGVDAPPKPEPETSRWSNWLDSNLEP